LRSPHGRDLIGAATGFGADGCSAVAIDSITLRIHGNSDFVIVIGLGMLKNNKLVKVSSIHCLNMIETKPKD
jgi:hypothetical protein